MSPTPAGRTHRHRVAGLVALALATAIAPAIALSTPSYAAAAATTVTLTFDDGSQDQYDNARPLLLAHHLPGTFFINSGRVNTAGYMTRAEIAQLATDGDEIGGHTIDHADLPTLSSDDQKREVCNDRVALLGMGFTVKSFAYPFGDASATTEQIVAGCGYNSARTVGGVVSRGSCQGCPYAESIPPADAYFTQTPDSVKTTTSLATLQGYVTQAQNNGGGWVQLVIHHVCDGCGDDYSISPATLGAFLDWLATSGARVATVDGVIGGTLKPPVSGPPLPPPPSGNLAQNPSVETASASGVPTCYQLGGYGTNTASFSHTTDAHTGTYAEQVTISAYTSGDRKLVTVQDTSSCVPTAIPGHSYHLRAWYKGSWAGTVQVKVTAYYRDTNGTWVYWTSGPALPATGTWTQTPDYVTPAAPANATAISLGVALAGVGTLTTDDYSITDTAT